MSVFFLVLLWVVRTVAQSSNVTTCIPQYSWAINSRNQTPCLVAAYLETVCSDQPVIIPSLPPDNHYLGPNFIQANICVCNVVVYSLVSACGGCQGRDFTNWGNWTLNCAQIDNKTYPKATPAAVEIPNWARYDISKTNWTFNATVASAIAASEAPQSSIQPGTASTSAESDLPAPTEAQPSETEAQPSESAATSEKTSHAGAIAGGVVGGLAGISLIALAVFWFFLKRDGIWKNQRKNHQRIDLDAEGLQPTSMGDVHKGHTVSQSMSNVRRSGPLSNTSLLEPQSTGDAFTPVTSPMFTTLSVRNSMDSLPFTGSQVTRGAYSGAAEI